MYDSQIAHGSLSSRVEQSVGNGIFVHLLCGSVPLPTVWLRTALSGCVYTNCTKLRGPIAPCTPGVRKLDSSSMFTRLWRTICNERHFCTPAVRICTTLRSRTSYSVLAVCTQAVPNCEVLLLPVHQVYDHYTSQTLLTRPWQTICSERHFRTPAVLLCTPPTNRSFTIPVECVYRS